MGLFSKIKGCLKHVPLKEIGSKLPPPPMMYPSENPVIWVRLSVSRKGDRVDIQMLGLECVNVCLASFLTKGVSYAQEKYNEYKKLQKDIEPIAMIKGDSVKERQGMVEVKKGGKR